MIVLLFLGAVATFSSADWTFARAVAGDALLTTYLAGAFAPDAASLAVAGFATDPSCKGLALVFQNGGTLYILGVRVHDFVCRGTTAQGHSGECQCHYTDSLIDDICFHNV